jgi:hypothetical protein
MDRFSKTCLVLIVLLLGAIAFRPMFVPTSAHAASGFYHNWRTASVTQDGLNEGIKLINESGCDIVSAMPINGGTTGTVTGASVGGGTHTALFILKCPNEAPAPVKK